MATKKPQQFDQVDWEEFSESRGFAPSINTIGMLVTTAVLVAVFGYDWRFVGEREPLLTIAGQELSPTGIDYMFLFTLGLFAFYLVLPLYQNPRMTRYYWDQFKRNRPAVISLGWLVILFAGGLIGPFLLNAPQQNLPIGYQPPVFSSIDSAYVAECVGTMSGGQCTGTWDYPLGTTRGGEGIFRHIVYGMTISMKIGFIATTIAVTIATAFGTVSAYAGGWVDEILMRYVDIQQSLPTLIIYLLIIYIFGGGLWLLILLLGVFSWGGMARYVRSKSLSVAEEEFIKATKISGASQFRVVRRHVVPNSASSIVTDITLLVPGFLLAEAQLSFLGLGDPSVYSWGQLIATGRSDLAFAPWIVLAPGIVLFLTILAFNFIGDALLDALNPKAEAESET